MYPLATPTQVGEPSNTSKQTLGILRIMSCYSSWRSFAGRLHCESWMHPPKPTTNTLGRSYGKWGSWCRWPGGHLSKMGRVGSPRATISTSCPCTTRWRVEAQRTTFSPPAPVQSDGDVGWLINTLAMGSQLGTPQINTFSSNAMPGKMEVLFKQWYLEVNAKFL